MGKQKSIKQRQNEVWAGSRLPLHLPMDPPQALEVDFWVEGSTGRVLMSEIHPAGGDLSAFAQTLAQAVETPIGGQAGYVPGAVLVDRPELAAAIETMSKKHRFEVEVRSSVADDLRELVERLESDLGEIREYSFLGDGDVTPGKVTHFYKLAHRYLNLEPWQQYQSGEPLEIQGLREESLYCSVLGAEGEYGLALYPNREAAEVFFSGEAETGEEAPSLALLLYENHDIGETLKSEAQANGWPAHDLGMPILIRGDRLERPNPTNDELESMSKALEAICCFLEDENSQLMPFEISTGEIVRVSVAEDLIYEFLELDFESVDEAIEALDQLWAEGDLDQAASVAAAYLHQTDVMEPSITYRLAAYLCVAERFDDVDALWKEFSQIGGAEWFYVGAYLEVCQGHKPSAARLLKKGLKHSPALASTLLDEASVDDFARLWGPIWRDNQDASSLLRKSQSEAKPAKTSKPVKAAKTAKPAKTAKTARPAKAAKAEKSAATGKAATKPAKAAKAKTVKAPASKAKKKRS